MRAVWARVRADLRSRWMAWLAVALAIGLAGAVVLLTAAAGARRTGTAFERFRAASHAEDLYLSPTLPEGADREALLAELEALPQVERPVASRQ